MSGFVTGAPAKGIDSDRLDSMTAAEATAFLNAFTATLKGAVPPPGSVTGTAFLCDNGTWVTLAPFSGDAADIVTGTLDDARLSANVALLDTTNLFTQSQVFKGDASKLYFTSGTGETFFAISNSGTDILSVFDSNGTDGAGKIFADGSLLINISDSALSANVPLLNADNMFSGTNSFGSLRIIGDVYPDSDLVYNLGTDVFRWATIYTSGLIVHDHINMDIGATINANSYAFYNEFGSPFAGFEGAHDAANGDNRIRFNSVIGLSTAVASFDGGLNSPGAIGGAPSSFCITVDENSNEIIFGVRYADGSTTKYGTVALT